ncbi:hypothetical protein SDC9_183073 [bioreactor metagenome]|uniref:Uncharacterized protein n=1 Tax=bioreactor metagenome TaxID=1076179 RepID=A0A645H9A3_9ZZZZ
MGQKGLSLPCALVYDTAEPAAAVLVKIAQRQADNVVQRLAAHIARCSESCQVRTHQGCKIDNDSCQGKSHGQPAIVAQVLSLPHVGQHRENFPHHLPDADKGHEDQNRADPG